MGTRLKDFNFCEDVETYLKVKKPSTRSPYQSALAKFQDYYKRKHGKDVTIANFLDRVSENRQKPRRQRKRLAEMELNGFIEYLTKLEKSANTIGTYVAAIQNLLKFHHLPVSTSFIRLPNPVVETKNRKHEWTLKNVKEFFEKATNYRDKAVVLCLFQSGMGIGELCRLNYGDVQKELESGVLPLCLRIVRQKTSVDYRTFFGRDAVHFLKLYLETRNNLTNYSPLFTKLGSDQRVTEGSIQARFREIAKKCSFLSKEQLDTGLNPCRPHSLRSAFRSRLTGKMDGDLIEYFMGHVLPEQKLAYINIPVEELRELYANYEYLLVIEMSSKDAKAEIPQKPERLTKLYGKIATLEEDLSTYKDALKHLSKDLAAQKRLTANFYKMTGIDAEILAEVLQEAYRKSLEEEEKRLQQETLKEQERIDAEIKK